MQKEAVRAIRFTPFSGQFLQMRWLQWFREGVIVLLTLFCVCAIAAELPAQVPNRPSSPDFRPYEFQQVQVGDFGYYLMTPRKIFSLGAGFHPADAAKPMILDPNGYVAWYRHQSPAAYFADFKYNEEAKSYTWFEFISNSEVYYQVLDTHFQPLDTIRLQNNLYPDPHEFFIRSNGVRVLSALRDTVFDLTGYVFNGIPGGPSTGVRCFVIQEVDSIGNLVWEWNSCDHIHPGEGYGYYGFGLGTFDYCHGNSIEEEPDGNYLLSFRHLNAVIKIDRTTGNVIWKLGGKANQFTFVNDSGFSGQHDARRLPNGNITLFDNGNMANPQQSRAVEYALDTLLMTATRVWEYQSSPPTFAKTMGNHDRLGPARVMSYGSVFRPSSNVETVDPTGNLIHRIILADSFQTYRTHISALPQFPERPEISCSDSTGSIVLTAPSGFANYLWSTSETTSSILAQPNITYQFWVPQGVGMIGSHPITIDTQGNCPITVGIPSPASGPEPELIKITDLLGRTLTQPIPGMLLLYHYSDGSIRKKVGLSYTY